MVVATRFVVTVGLAMLALSTVESSAQVGLVDDLLKGAAKAGKAGKLARAGRIAADVTDTSGRILRRLPASASTRKTFGLTLTAAAKDAFEAVPHAAGRPRVFLGHGDDGLKFIPDTANTLDPTHASGAGTLDKYLEAIHASGQKIEGVDYVVEADVLPGAAPRLGPGDRMFLANYGADPWPVTKVGDRAFAAEVTPSLWLRISEATVEDGKHLLDLSFDPADMRVGSFFDEAADVESVEALRTAAGTTSFRNIGSAEEALEFVGKSRGKVVALIGHVEDQQFVVAGLNGETFRVDIASLVEVADRRDVSLLLLGCDTAAIEAASGVSGRINSIAVASQLRQAVAAGTYGEFLSAMGTPANPLVLSREMLGRAQMIVGTRLRREARGQRAGVVSVQASPKLALLQTRNAEQTFRSLPPWLDKTIAGALGLTFWAFLISGVVAAFKHSWSPVTTTAHVIVTLIRTPLVAVRRLFASR